ncbi:MAG: DUF1127 domain-containing protein [Rhodobacteraceae bacterium]|nr:DUF1127 domain-containing protein [Paracoccaceae bacterium]
MTTLATSLHFEGVSEAISSFFSRFIAVCEEVGRARASRAMYAELSAMSDAELDQYGLKRDDVTRTIYSKVSDVR